MKTILMLLSAVLLTQTAFNRSNAQPTAPKPAAVQEWAHGYETKNIKATRYSNPHMGFNIGFTFPNHRNQCDDARLIKWIESRDGFVYQCGGYPGAEMFAKFKAVTDKDSASKWLRENLGDFERTVAALK